MPKRIIIIRHGETQYNVERRIQGWIDIPLNENGHTQAQKLAERLSQELVSQIYTSDQKRAHETAKYISQRLMIKPRKRKALRESRLGIFEGWDWEKKPDVHKQKLWEQRTIARTTGDLNWKVEGGESIKEHLARINKFINQIEKLHPIDTILIVSHGGTINCMLEIYGLKNMTDEYISFKNTSVTILTKKPLGYQLELQNDISHL